ncbi:MAG TPA: potassium-transporting ATPase subunit KdpA, partial [Thermoanaerobaculia bacterium]|nr:potassium-transporting ATPase subunit KdpA [Thermoanaerobaculia bacterium]
TFLDPVLRPLERAIYRLCRVDPQEEQPWTVYTIAMLAFSLVSMLALYALERLQGYLPANPQKFGGVAPDLAWNTAASFTTNTDWQAYSGESTMSDLTQMAGLALHNFTSAAIGIALAIAFIRGISRREAKTIGNFWVDLVRGSLYLLLPLCLVGALVLVSQGVVQNLAPYTRAALVEPQEKRTEQLIAQGPVASQEIIKELGTNGGGFMNANSAHPFENPTPATNFLEMLAIFAIGSGLTYTLGRMTGNQRHGWAVFTAMLILFLAGFAVVWQAEAAGNPALGALGLAGGNMEGKEVRFGIASSALFATITTDASCGAINSWHDSFTPLGGMIPLLDIMLGEIIFGGVGSGLYGMLLFAIVAVFVAGLMVGRTPEYLGKKIGAREVKFASLYFLTTPTLVLVGTAAAMALASARASMLNSGAHGLSEVLYAFTSAANNNGSAFAGIGVNTNFWNTALGVVMLLGRFLPIVFVLGLAGSLASQGTVPPSAGTLPTHRLQFVAMVTGVVLIVVALTYLPALALGPL